VIWRRNETLLTDPEESMNSDDPSVIFLELLLEGPIVWIVKLSQIAWHRCKSEVVCGKPGLLPVTMDVRGGPGTLSRAEKTRLRTIRTP
jgi:hypothetical protein